MKEVRLYQLHIATIFITFITTVYGRYFGAKTLKQRLRDGFFTRLGVAGAGLTGALAVALFIVLLLVMGGTYDEVAPLFQHLAYLSAVGLIALALVLGTVGKYVILFTLTQLWEDGLKGQIGHFTGIF